MTDLLWALIVAADILAIADILNKIRGTVPRFLWIVCVLALPVIGAGFWGYVQYYAPKRKRIERVARERLSKKQKAKKEK